MRVLVYKRVAEKLVKYLSNNISLPVVGQEIILSFGCKVVKLAKCERKYSYALIGYGPKGEDIRAALKAVDEI